MILLSADGSTQWNIIMMFILTWVPRIGGVMLFGGAIEYAIAHQSDNPSQKTQAIRFIVSGSMTLAISWSLRTLIII